MLDRAVGLEECGEEIAIRRHARELLAQEHAERGIERDLVGDLRLLEQAARGECVLDEDAVAEPVDREDRRVVERGDGGAEPALRVVVDGPHRVARRIDLHARQAIEQIADAHAQLGDRLLGERDEQQLPQLGAGEDQVDHAVLEEVRLAGAGGRLDDHEAIGGRGQGARASDDGHDLPSKPWPPCMRSTSGPKRRIASAFASGGASRPSARSIGP